MTGLESRLSRLLRNDLYLTPFSDQIRHRLERIEETEQRLTRGKMSLAEFASGHEYFGLHFRRDEWVFREWAPNATAIYLIGDMSNWEERKEFELKKISDDGVWETRLTADKLPIAICFGSVFIGQEAKVTAFPLMQDGLFKIPKL